MKKYFFLVLGVIILISAVILTFNPDQDNNPPQTIVSSFEDCVAMDGSVADSYPQQCQYGEQVFVEDLIQLVGNDKDEHGCIGSAGYSWCEAKEKCLRIWEEPCEENNPVVNQSISSEDLGIKVSYYSGEENEVKSKIDGNKIYFFMGSLSEDDYKSGQSLEIFKKDTSLDFKKSIENKFLKNINKDKCFVKIIEDTDNYQKAIIDYPDNPCPNGEPFFACNSCPEGYSKTNGISYFMYYKNHPETYFYFSIGQYSLAAVSSQILSSLEWFNNIEFIK